MRERRFLRFQVLFDTSDSTGRILTFILSSSVFSSRLCSKSYPTTLELLRTFLLLQRLLALAMLLLLASIMRRMHHATKSKGPKEGTPRRKGKVGGFFLRFVLFVVVSSFRFVSVRLTFFILILINRIRGFCSFFFFYLFIFFFF